jgi:hypothetical protein
MHRQVVLSGLAGDPERPLTWGYQDMGARIVRTQRERHAVAISDVRDPQPTLADPIDAALN